MLPAMTQTTPPPLVPAADPEVPGEPTADAEVPTPAPTTSSVGTAYIDIIPRLKGPVIATAPPKPGVKTSEFWASAVSSLALVGGALWLFLSHRIDQGAFVTIEGIGGGGVPGVYAILRTILKSVAPTISLPDPNTPPAS